ncbi:MAG TPA: TonB family protein [Edaphobacter sp.]|nr:TonB family protein [Edaphobacter sp.]
MFEDSTFESNGIIHTRSRNWSLAALAFNGTIVAALAIIPLIYPEALPQRLANILLTAPSAPQPEVKPVPVELRGTAFHGRQEFTDLKLTAPTQIPTQIRKFDGPERPANLGDTISMGGPGTNDGIPGGDIFRNTGARAVHPMVKQQSPTHISGGVAAGLLIQKTIPTYPPLGKAMRVEGTVVLQAIIAKSGKVINLRVASGPSILQQAALDAVSTWRYRPYLLNGEPVDVETTINVVFTLSH